MTLTRVKDTIESEIHLVAESHPRRIIPEESTVFVSILGWITGLLLTTKIRLSYGTQETLTNQLWLLLTPEMSSSLDGNEWINLKRYNNWKSIVMFSYKPNWNTLQPFYSGVLRVQVCCVPSQKRARLWTFLMCRLVKAFAKRTCVTKLFYLKILFRVGQLWRKMENLS